MSELNSLTLANLALSKPRAPWAPAPGKVTQAPGQGPVRAPRPPPEDEADPGNVESTFVCVQTVPSNQGDCGMRAEGEEWSETEREGEDRHEDLSPAGSPLRRLGAQPVSHVGGTAVPAGSRTQALSHGTGCPEQPRNCWAPGSSRPPAQEENGSWVEAAGSVS